MADNNLKSIIKLLARKLKSFLYTKDVLSFLLFVILSAAFWFVNALDKNRNINIIIPVNFVDLPTEIAFTNKVPREIAVDIRDEGINLFSYSNKKIKPLNIKLNQKFSEKGEIIIYAGQINNLLQSYLLPTTQIIGIKPDSITIHYEKLVKKRVPVELVTKIDLMHQFMLSDKIDIKPNQIDIYGPKRILDTIEVIQTNTVVLKNLKDTTVLSVNLKKHSNIKYKTHEVRVTYYVEMFTEKKAEIPVSTINFPLFMNVRTFPAVVNATFNIGISHFNSYKTTDFQIIIDYNEIKELKSSKYKLKISNDKSYINNIRLSPQEVEYILEE